MVLVWGIRPPLTSAILALAAAPWRERWPQVGWWPVTHAAAPRRASESPPCSVGAVRDKGNEAHLATTQWTQQREDFVDAGDQHSSQVMRRCALGRHGHERGGVRVARRCCHSRRVLARRVCARRAVVTRSPDIVIATASSRWHWVPMNAAKSPCQNLATIKDACYETPQFCSGP